LLDAAYFIRLGQCRGDSKKVSYGGRLCSIVGWLGYGGNLTWRKQVFCRTCLRGSHLSEAWQNASVVPGGLEPSYQQWLYIQPGVRCVDETTYIDGIKYWLWVATSNQVLLLAPTRSSAELKQLLGENFEGFSAVIAHTPTIRRPPPSKNV